MAPWPEFEGIKEVLPARDQAECWGEKIFAFSDADMMRNSVCMRERRLELKVVYQPSTGPRRPTPSTARAASPSTRAACRSPTTRPTTISSRSIGYEAGVTDQGSGVREKSSPYNVPYHVLPRRECFAVLLVDEWGREIGDRRQRQACIDIPVLDALPAAQWHGAELPRAQPLRDPHARWTTWPATRCVWVMATASLTSRPSARIPGTGGMSGEGGASGGGSGTAATAAAVAPTSGDGGMAPT
jgi:hypothetical protein